MVTVQLQITVLEEELLAGLPSRELQVQLVGLPQHLLGSLGYQPVKSGTG